MGCGSSKPNDSLEPTIQSNPIPTASTLSKPVIPCIPIEKSIAFEIPLDHLRAPRLSLPKLQPIDMTLADTEARWKVHQDLENLLFDLDSQVKKPKPMLSSGKKKPQLTKETLLQKEHVATLNRQREIMKLQNKLAKQEEHAKLVLERKKKLCHSLEKVDLSCDEMNMVGKQDLIGFRTGSGRSNMTESTDTTDVVLDANDHGKHGIVLEQEFAL